MSHEHVVHVDAVSENRFGEGQRFGSRHRRLGQAAGGERLQCTLYEVDPGRTAFPFHAHFGIEEAIYVLEGSGTLRIGDARIEVGPGHYAAFPVGRATAHQLLNTGDGPLRYLCLSAGSDPDVVVYPDSRKVGAMAGGWPPEVRLLSREGESLGYWDGEETG